jgi:hypothetical protein
MLNNIKVIILGFLIKNRLMILCLALTGCMNAHAEVAPEQLNIVIEKGKLSINNNYIKFPFSMSDLTKISGPYDKITKNGSFATWNKCLFSGEE